MSKWDKIQLKDVPFYTTINGVRHRIVNIGGRKNNRIVITDSGEKISMNKLSISEFDRLVQILLGWT